MDNSIQPALKVMVFFLLVTSILAVTARGATKAVIVHSISDDDYFISLSLVSTTSIHTITLETSSLHPA